MHFSDMLLLLAFCLVLTKAEGEDLFDEPAEETEISGDDPGFLDDETDIAIEAAAMEDAKVRRKSVNPPILRPITIPISVPGNVNSLFFKTCYCFRRVCRVKGMSRGFKGWIALYQYGYVVIGDYLYKFYHCGPKGR